MTKEQPPPSDGKSGNQSCTDQAREVADADDQRAIIKKLRKPSLDE
jgi:hypothetical protein